MINLKDERKEILFTLSDKDIFPDISEFETNIVWKDRPTGKIVVFNEKNQIALIGNKVNEFFQLPGGGIEDNENLLEGLRRECKEETGCEVQILQALGITEDFRLRDAKHCINYGYSGKVISYGTPVLTASETDIGVYVKWFSLSEAITLFSSQEKKIKAGEVKFYNTCFNIIRDSFFIKRAEDLIGNV